MAKSIADKLRIKEGFVLLGINLPADFTSGIGDLPNGVSIVAKGKKYNQLHWFVRNRMQLEKELDKVLPLITKEVLCWIYYPKTTSNLQTDLTRDKGWDNLLKQDNLQWVSLVSFNDTWSTFGCRLKTDADIKKENKPKHRPILDYIDPATKTVTLPEDLRIALTKNKTAQLFFNALSFTNRKEYVEWVVTAKREATKTERIRATIEKLGKGWKNPSNN